MIQLSSRPLQMTWKLEPNGCPRLVPVNPHLSHLLRQETTLRAFHSSGNKTSNKPQAGSPAPSPRPDSPAPSAGLPPGPAEGPPCCPSGRLPGVAAAHTRRYLHAGPPAGVRGQGLGAADLLAASPPARRPARRRRRDFRPRAPAGGSVSLAARRPRP